MLIYRTSLYSIFTDIHRKRNKKPLIGILSEVSKRAEDGTQTRDPQLGRLMLYQLSYFRIYFAKIKQVGSDGFEPPKSKDS